MINSKGKCSFNENLKKHITWFDKLTNQEEVEEEEVVEENEKTEEQKLMDKFNDPSWLYENHLITYEEYLKQSK